jgi:hypothetical protein
MVKVTADQVTALRNALTGDSEGHKRMYDHLSPDDKKGYTFLVVTSFLTMAERRFGGGGTKAQVVEFVGDLRSRYGLEDEVDPRAAEHLLLAAFSDDVDIDDFDHERHGQLYIILLAGLVRDADLSDSELDALLVDTRKLADKWLAEEG